MNLPTENNLLAACFALATVAAVVSLIRAVYARRLAAETTLAPAMAWLAILLAVAGAEGLAYVLGPSLLLHHSLAILTSILFVLPTLFILCARRGRLMSGYVLVISFLVITANTLWLQLFTGRFETAGRPGLHQVRFLYLAVFTALVAGNHVLSRLRIPIFLATAGAFLHLLSVGPWPQPWEPWARAVGLLLISAAPLYPIRLRPEPDRVRCLARRFVDLWGLLWWEHVRERFNDAARRRRWPVQLTLQGLVDAETEQPVEATEAPPGTVEELCRLLERFGDATFFTRWCPEQGATQAASN